MAHVDQAAAPDPRDRAGPSADHAMCPHHRSLASEGRLLSGSQCQLRGSRRVSGSQTGMWGALGVHADSASRGHAILNFDP